MSVPGWYYLDDNNVTHKCVTRGQIMLAHTQVGAVVGHTIFTEKKITISTVFLALGGDELFETIIFKDDEKIYCKRYKTWQDAYDGHKNIQN